MGALDLKKLLLGSTLLVGMTAFALPTAVMAQEDEDDEVAEIEEEEEFADSGDTVVITGSRIRRDTFSSTSPLQVLDGETIADAGFLDLGEALRTTSVVQGVQLDAQFNSTFVSEAGPGGQSVALRGLNPERTLVLINGRRYAPAGIEGAPSFPDISLIPTSIIERNEILLDGASSVYGSDAIAGVINIILRDDFEGLEIGAQYNEPLETSAESWSVDFIAGTGGSRGNFVIAGEYFKQEPLFGNERDWMCGVTANGEAPNAFPDYAGQEFCHSRRIDNNGEYLGTGTLGQQFAIMNGSTAFILLPRPGTANPAVTPDGAVLPNFEYASLGGNFNGLYGSTVPINQNIMLTPEFERGTLFSNTSVALDDFIEGTEWFSEFSLSNRRSTFVSPRTTFQFTNDPLVTPADYGFDADAFTPEPNPFIQQANLDDYGNLPFVFNPFLPGDGGVKSELTQYRFITGLRGDMNFTDLGFLQDWDYELFYGYTRSQGYSTRRVVLEENLLKSLDVVTDPDSGAPVCRSTRNPLDGFFGGSENLEPCIPFNPFYVGLYDGNNPQFDDERLNDYLIGSRSSTTFVDEAIFGGFITGDVFDLPAGTVKTVLGFEWREDTIDTRSDDVTSRGLGQGFFRDLPSNGDVDQKELFAEVIIPLLADKPLVEMLEAELAGRFVDNEFYGSNSTYAAKLRYEPTDWLTLRGTYGTSFRAPNLRDLFLQGQSSFDPNLVDPCEVPRLAQTDTDGDGVLDTYTPGADEDGDGVGDLDGRNPRILDNCASIGVDPFSLAIGVNYGSVEVFDAGNTGLDPETSESYSYGFVLDQPWFDSFDLQLGVSFWGIDISDAVFDPSAQFLVSSCLVADDFPDNAFCTRQGRDPAVGYLREVDATPFNIGSEKAEGIDFNATFSKDFTAFDTPFTYSVQGQATQTKEDSVEITLGDSVTFEDAAGEIGSPEWRGFLQQRLTTGDFDFFWSTQYIGDQAQPISDATGGATGVCSETPECYSVEEVIYHTLSTTYRNDDWTLRVGVQNVLDETPPQIDERTLGVSLDDRNVPVGVGYDRFGRTVFLNVSKSF